MYMISADQYEAMRGGGKTEPDDVRIVKAHDAFVRQRDAKRINDDKNWSEFGNRLKPILSSYLEESKKIIQQFPQNNQGQVQSILHILSRLPKVAISGKRLMIEGEPIADPIGDIISDMMENDVKDVKAAIDILRGKRSARRTMRDTRDTDYSEYADFEEDDLTDMASMKTVDDYEPFSKAMDTFLKSGDEKSMYEYLDKEKLATSTVEKQSTPKSKDTPKSTPKRTPKSTPRTAPKLSPINTRFRARTKKPATPAVTPNLIQRSFEKLLNESKAEKSMKGDGQSKRGAKLNSSSRWEPY